MTLLFPQVPVRSVTERTANWNRHDGKREHIRYVDVSAVSREELAIVDFSEHTSETAPSRAQKLLQQKDTLFATIRPGLRRIAFVPPELDASIASTAFCILRPAPGKIDPLFLFYAVLDDAFVSAVEELQTGASYPAVRDKDVLEQNIPLPPLQEQSKISKALSAVRQLMLCEAKALGLAQNVKRSTMKKLFTLGLRGEEQKQTEIGLVSESWEVGALGEHYSVASGGTPSRRNSAFWTEGTIPWVKTAEVGYCIISGTEEHITPEGLAASAAKMLPAGTLLMAMYGQGVTRGKVAILGIEAACNQACAAISPTDDTVLPGYLYHFLSWRYDAIRSLAHGGQQQNLNLDIVRELSIAYPLTHEEQQEIVEILDALDRKIDLHRKKRAVLEELFKSLLHKLMTGEIRVDQLDLSALESPAPQNSEAAA